jgi:hypothetical protein
MNQIIVTDGTSQPITSAGPAAPTTGLAIATLTGAYELSLEVISFSTTSGVGHCRIVAEDSVNAFTAALPVAEWTFQCGVQGISPAASVKRTETSGAEPGLRLNTTSAVLRFNVVEIDGTGASLTFQGILWN